MMCHAIIGHVLVFNNILSRCARWLLTQKPPTHLSMAYTTQGHHLTTLISLHKTFHLTPTPPKEPKDEEKG